MKLRKIIIASPDISTGGLGSYIDTLATGLKVRGWDVHFISTNTRGDFFDLLKKSVECHDLSEQPLSRKKILKAAELVNSISPDILLMNNCSLIHYTLPLVGNKTKPIAVLHSNDDRFYKTAAFCGRRIFRWIAPTQGVADRCKTYLSQEQRKSVYVIPHGIDPALFTVNRNRGKKISGNICFVGFIAENKGADLLPDILLRVSLAYPDVRLTIVGHGPLERTLKSLCEANGILDKCIFTGRVRREKVAEVLRASGILVLPTRIEGFGLSIVEAMMSGTVPVVSKIKGVTDDIVSHGITGSLIEPDDTEGFADAIVDLLKNPVKLISMSEAARETAAHRYSSQKMLDAYETLFGEDDNRQNIPCKGTVGWMMEAIQEVMKKGIDRTWISNRITGNWK